MDQPTPPSGSRPEPGSALLWLLLGLAPIPILLTIVSHPPRAPFPALIVALCALLNVCGGVGCLSRVRNWVARVCLGLLLGSVLFVLSWVIFLFQACSHTRF